MPKRPLRGRFCFGDMDAFTANIRQIIRRCRSPSRKVGFPDVRRRISPCSECISVLQACACQIRRKMLSSNHRKGCTSSHILLVMRVILLLLPKDCPGNSGFPPPISLFIFSKSPPPSRQTPLPVSPVSARGPLLHLRTNFPFKKLKSLVSEGSSYFESRAFALRARQVTPALL